MIQLKGYIHNHNTYAYTLSYPVGTGAGWETTLHVVAVILRMPHDSH